MNNMLIKLEGVSHRYSKNQFAVKDISFSLPKKGIFGLLGVNGAGKSTVMNIMSGVLKQTEGRVLVDGLDLAVSPIEAKKLIGFLPQYPPLYEDTTIEEYLINCCHLRRIPDKDIKRAVEEVLEKCSITHFKNRLIRNLSGGYKQRVGIAQAIIHNPPFIILDEPTNGLDPNQILEIRNLIKNISGERTVLLSTHMLTEVQALCEDVVMINHGRIVFSGSMEEFNNYLQPNLVVAKFLSIASGDELKSINSVEYVEDLGESTYSLDISGEADLVIQNIIKKSIEKDWKLIGIGKEKRSLNDIFSVLSKHKIKE